MEKKPNAPPPKSLQKEFIVKALTDPGFRRKLVAEPAKTLGRAKTGPAVDRELAVVLAAVEGIEAQIDHIADVLFCALKVVRGAH